MSIKFPFQAPSLSPRLYKGKPLLSTHRNMFIMRMLQIFPLNVTATLTFLNIHIMKKQEYSALEPVKFWTSTCIRDMSKDMK